MRLLGAYDRDRQDHPPIPHHDYELVFLFEILEDTSARAVDTDGLGFFGENELPELSVYRVTPPQVRRLSSITAGPGWWRTSISQHAVFDVSQLVCARRS